MKKNSIIPTFKDQKKFWENQEGRRQPNHPVIEAFAIPKIDFVINAICKSEALEKNTSLLDIGSGNGFFSYYLERDFNVTTFDFSFCMLKNNPVKPKVLGSALELPFKNNSYDIVFCSNLLHHLWPPEVAVREMVRVSRRFIALSEPNRNNPLMFLYSVLKAEERGTVKFSKSYLEGLLKKAKCEVVAAGGSGGILPNITPLALLPILKKLEFFVYPRFYFIAIGRK